MTIRVSRGYSRTSLKVAVGEASRALKDGVSSIPLRISRTVAAIRAPTMKATRQPQAFIWSGVSTAVRTSSSRRASSWPVIRVE